MGFKKVLSKVSYPKVPISYAHLLSLSLAFTLVCMNVISNSHTGFFGRLKAKSLGASKAMPRMLGLFEFRVMLVILTATQPIFGYKLTPIMYITCHASVVTMLYILDVYVFFVCLSVSLSSLFAALN